MGPSNKAGCEALFRFGFKRTYFMNHSARTCAQASKVHKFHQPCGRKCFACAARSALLSGTAGGAVEEYIGLKSCGGEGILAQEAGI